MDRRPEAIVTSLEPTARPPLSKTRTTDRQSSFSPSTYSQEEQQLFVLKEYSLVGHNTARGPLERLARFSLDRHEYIVTTYSQIGQPDQAESYVIHHPPDTPESHVISWRLDEGCRFVQTLDFDRKVPPFALFETSIEGGHADEVVYTVVPFSQTVKTRQPVDTSHYFPLTQICGKSTTPSVISYLPLQFPPRQYDRRIRHGLAGRIRTARADIPVFYTLGTRLGIRGRRCEIWAYLIKLEKGEVQAYHHNSLEVPADASRCICTPSLFGVFAPDRIILWQLENTAHLPLESPMHRFEVLCETKGLIEIYQVNQNLLIFAFQDRLARYHLAEKQLEQQYVIQLPKKPSDIFFLHTYTFLVHPEQIVILDLSTGLEVQVTEGEFRVLDRPSKGISGRYQGQPGTILQAGREANRPICYKLEFNGHRAPGVSVACLSL
ncbi:hypothetical protein FFLO_04025 [Filobasidium floriforme]|uniref:Uncharacterized protein n=1 Tax=Filobasidium floriforme TaxID=5210 RepID=A0A8K0JL40_9TREE|nr:hypothetical protein FFLO_04025 [Filobasidium floriforme]